DRRSSRQCRRAIDQLFAGRLGDRAIVWPQNPVRLRVVRSVPQPDVVLLRPRTDFYASGKPGPDDVLLLIEVMDTSVETDRRVKLPLYARAGIAETWLLDLQTDRVETFRRPITTGYGQSATFQRGQRLAPQ